MKNNVPKHLKKEKEHKNVVAKHETEEKQKQDITIEEAKTRKKYKLNVFICLIYAILIEMYFVSLNIINTNMTDKFEIYVKSSYMIFIIVSVIIFEISYKKQNKNLLIQGIEFLILAIHILLIQRTITFFNTKEKIYILATSSIWPMYYCLKAVLIQTKESRRRLKQISDISEIVKEEKPVKKVAKKRKK